MLTKEDCEKYIGKSIAGLLNYPTPTYFYGRLESLSDSAMVVSKAGLANALKGGGLQEEGALGDRLRGEKSPTIPYDSINFIWQEKD